MLRKKGHGKHSAAGKVYFWSLAALFVSAAVLAPMRWSEDGVLLLFGASAFACALFGRSAVWFRWPYWTRLHLTGMGFSYALMLAAFYVDNGKQLPVWRDLPPVVYWLLPLAVAAVLIARALTTHPLRKLGDSSGS